MNTHATRRNSRNVAIVVLGVALIAVGLTLLIGRVDLAISRLFLAPGASVDANSSFPAVVLLLDRAAQAWAFDRPALFSSARQILLSCWPVLLVLLGAVLLQDWRSATRTWHRQVIEANGRRTRQ